MHLLSVTLDFQHGQMELVQEIERWKEKCNENGILLLFTPQIRIVVIESNFFLSSPIFPSAVINHAKANYQIAPIHCNPPKK